MKHYAIKLTATLFLAIALQACGSTTVKYKAVNDFCYHSQPIYGGEGVPIEVQGQIDAHNAVYDAQCEDMLDEMQDDATNDMTQL